ncbi:hypothetical protein FRB90_011396 [Tulasnella sp. 427]|nr:hypothetical protein FRB90_011396 [Tulasnella sp. 427]
MVSFKLSTLVVTATLALLSSAKAKKRGLAWPREYQSYVRICISCSLIAHCLVTSAFDPKVFLPGGKVNWLYNWHTEKEAIYSSIPSFYAMQWDSEGIANLTANLKADGAHTLLGFNEPDNGGQANLTPAAAASLWKQYFEPIKARHPNIKLISPAVTNGGPPSGLAWLDSFLGNCTSCHIDGVAIHWYGGWIDDFKSFVNDSKKYNKPLYMTEFGLDWDQYATVDSFTQFLPLAMSYLDSEPAVVKYAFFGAFHSGTAKDMLDANGQLTTVGKLYIS